VLTSAGGTDIFVAKITAGGVHLWSKRYGAAGNQDGRDIAVDPFDASTGALSVTVYDVPPDAAGSVTQGGPGFTAAMTAPGQGGAVTFTATAGQSLVLNLSAVSVPIMRVSVLRPDGSALQSPSWVLGATSFGLTAPVAGTYTIVLDPYNDYTGSATVYAAAGQARATTTVDMSATYLDWAQQNLAANGFTGGAHEFIRADCISWLKMAVAERLSYDLIFLDPPTFSNSKRMEDVLDVQRDHAMLIDRCMALLAPGGLLVFSNNAQKFKMDAEISQRYKVKDISRATLPKDFERNPRIHQCFELEKTS